MKNCFVRVLPCFLIITLACQKKDGGEVVRLMPTFAADKLDDSTHISQGVFNIETAFNSYFVPDMYSSKIYRIDSSLHLTESIGRPGKGPGEFISPVSLCFNADDMYVVDAGEIKVYGNQSDHWEHEQKSKVPTLRGLNENHAYIVRDSTIYFASPMEHWVTGYRLSDRSIVSGFGKPFDLQPVDRNTMQLLDFNNSIYVIGVGEAVIYRYSYEGQQISFRDFRDEEIFQEPIETQNDFYREDSKNSLSSIFPAAAVINNKIHIIFYHRKRNNADSEYNKVLVVDPESYEITKTYQLGEGGFYTCISPSLTSKNGFVAFNARNASIEVFDLD